MLIAYCIRRAGDAPPVGITGIEDQPVHLLEEAGLGLWFSHGRLAGPDIELLRRYEQVNREALRSATPLPLRFGTHFRDVEGALAMLRSQRDRLSGTLERVGGSVEMGVRVFSQESHQPSRERPPVRSGRDYLERKRRDSDEQNEMRRRATSILERVDRFFAAVRLESAITIAAEPPLLGTIAHLVPYGSLTRYRACAEEAIRAEPDLRLRLTGPWAPYSFV